MLSPSFCVFLHLYTYQNHSFSPNLRFTHTVTKLRFVHFTFYSWYHHIRIYRSIDRFQQVRSSSARCRAHPKHDRLWLHYKALQYFCREVTFTAVSENFLITIKKPVQLYKGFWQYRIELHNTWITKVNLIFKCILFHVTMHIISCKAEYLAHEEYILNWLGSLNNSALFS
jgi:hypothetical protein